MTTINEPVRPSNNLTPEAYQEIKQRLESEDTSKFPSVFEQARNLMKQAWVSGIEAAKGRPLLASVEKSAARMNICQGCEFLRDTRCLKCGCFMDKKVHVEAASCPLNKWGSDLQTMLPQQVVDRNLKAPDRMMENIDIYKEFPNDATEIDSIANRALQYDGRFSWNGIEFKATINFQGQRVITQVPTRTGAFQTLSGYNALSDAEKIEFNQLVTKHQAADQPKIFAFQTKTFQLTPRSGGRPGFNLQVIDSRDDPPNQ